MRTVALALVSIGAVTSWSLPASAQRVSPLQTGRFVQFCSTPRNGGQLVCDAYITGMADSFALVQTMAKNSADGQTKLKPLICVPRETTGAAMRARVLAWIGGHKQLLHDPVGEVVYAALHESYPCGASGSE